jgi:hypothetical protein
MVMGSAGRPPSDASKCQHVNELTWFFSMLTPGDIV